MVNKLTEQEQKEYERLQNLEKFGKLAGKPLPKHVEDKLQGYRKRLEESIQTKGGEKVATKRRERIVDISEELKDFREKWEKSIEGVSDESKEKIINAAKNIDVKVKSESDGGRLIEFGLGNKVRKILDPKLENHTDNKYDCRNVDDKYIFNNNPHLYDITDKARAQVMLGGMRGDRPDQWENKKLGEYVSQKQREGRHIAKIEEVNDLLSELGKFVGLEDKADQMTMLMYLTGMFGWYRLSMGDEKRSGVSWSRSRLKLRYDKRGLFSADMISCRELFASLFMIR